MSVVVVAVLTPKPERRSEVRSALLEAVPLVHQEPGCELYSLHENETSFVFVERWSSARDLEVHSTAPALAGLGPLFAEALVSKVVEVVTPIEAGELAKSRF